MATIQLTIGRGVGCITLNRPKARNAINTALALELEATLSECGSRSDVQVVVLTGAEGTFCAGMDLKAFAAGEDIDTRRLPIALPVQQIISKPIIGAIEGYALGAGFELALACDLLIASQSAKFGLTEVKRGLVAGGGGVMRLVRQMPPRLAAEMILTGNMVEAAELGKWGLINRIVANETALTEAMTLASVIAANAPLAVAASTRLMRESPEWPAADMFARQNLITEPVFLTADAREGAMAFAEKRAPHWSGC